MECVEAAVTFERVCEGQTLSIYQHLSKAYNDKVGKNRGALLSIMKTIYLCGKQNIALRGNTDNRSNFTALIHYRSEYDMVLSEQLAHTPRNSQ